MKSLEFYQDLYMQKDHRIQSVRASLLLSYPLLVLTPILSLFFFDCDQRLARLVNYGDHLDRNHKMYLEADIRINSVHACMTMKANSIMLVKIQKERNTV